MKKFPITINITIKPLQERHFVTLAVFVLGVGLLLMARENPGLWDIELFKIILQAVIISGIIGMIMSFHFSANKVDETKIDNTGKAFDAIKATAAVVTAPEDVKKAAVVAADKVADAAIVAADKVAGDASTEEGNYQRE